MLATKNPCCWPLKPVLLATRTTQGAALSAGASDRGSDHAAVGRRPQHNILKKPGVKGQRPCPAEGEGLPIEG